MGRYSEADSPEGQEARFRLLESHLWSDIAALGAGATVAADQGTDIVVEAVAQLGPKSSGLPPWVRVHTDAEGVHLFASDKKGARGRQLMQASPQTFRASLHRNLGQLRLMVFLPERPPIALRARSWPRRAALHVARAVVELAKAPK